jgi:hypothetical protein
MLAAGATPADPTVRPVPVWVDGRFVVGAPAVLRPPGRRSGRISGGEVAVHELVRSRLAGVEALCRALGVRRLDLFGSAAEGTFDPESPVSVSSTNAA